MSIKHSSHHRFNTQEKIQQLIQMYISVDLKGHNSYSLKDIAQTFNADHATIKYHIKKLGIIRKGTITRKMAIGSIIKHSVPRYHHSYERAKSYKQYVKDAGYDGLKLSMGEMIAFKKKPREV